MTLRLTLQLTLRPTLQDDEDHSLASLSEEERNQIVASLTPIKDELRRRMQEAGSDAVAEAAQVAR